MDKISVGKLGEMYAARFLISRNYSILAKNFHGRFGEIDLIALDNSQHELAFIEVKTRQSTAFGIPEEAMTYHKRAKILKTIYCFFEQHKNNHHHAWRIDLIALQLNQQFKPTRVNHLKNI